MFDPQTCTRNYEENLIRLLLRSITELLEYCKGNARSNNNTTKSNTPNLKKNVCHGHYQL